MKDGTKKIANWKQFIMAGKSIVTIRNERNGGRFTYKVSKHKKQDLWFVGVLAGSDNMNSYRYLGCIFAEDGFRLTRNSKFGKDCSSFKVFDYLYNKVMNDEQLPDHIGIYHCGHCAACGRRLTVPESILIGYGPECYSRVDVAATDSPDCKKLKIKIAKLKTKIAKEL